MERDFEKQPYDAQEKRVCEYLQSITDAAGCGDDPVGFLIASHNLLRQKAQVHENALRNLVLAMAPPLPQTQTVVTFRRIAQKALDWDFVLDGE